MKIGFIYGVPIYPPGLGGSVHGFQLASGLAGRGHQLFSWYYGDDEIPFIHHFRGRQVNAFLRTIDVLYLRVSWSALMCKFARLRWLRWRHLPVVWELNASPDEILFYRDKGPSDMDAATKRLRGFAGRVDAAIGVTRAVQDYLQNTLGIDNSYVVPNGSDPKLFTPQQGPTKPELPLRVVWVGRPECPWHDVATLIEAARILHERKANIIIELYGPKKRLPEELPPTLRAMGPVPYSELGNSIGTADVGAQMFKSVNGLVKGGSPLKLYDYMASGLAVVAQDSGQTGEVIRKREAGLFFDHNANDLAQKLLSLEADRNGCRKLGENGRSAVVEYYNWERVAEETERVLQSVVS